MKAYFLRLCVHTLSEAISACVRACKPSPTYCWGTRAGWSPDMGVLVLRSPSLVLTADTAHTNHAKVITHQASMGSMFAAAAAGRGEGTAASSGVGWSSSDGNGRIGDVCRMRGDDAASLVENWS